MKTTPIPTFPLRGKERTVSGCSSVGCPIPTFPLRGKEAEGKSVNERKNSLPLRGRARVGVVVEISVPSVADRDF
jgi:hypothetical protein